MHVAAIVGTPVVALFSPHPAHAPEKWAPLGAGHTLLVAPLFAGEDPRVPHEKAEQVMSRIAVDRVLEANLRYAEAWSRARHEQLKRAS
jgi:ADP-heptose:LPS heptosyltransferase